ncbi:MAG: HAD family phosphatase [Oscillospiraceae bacterium]|nr:HAD family phosphatase [Oscillospiraceae bacterium]MDY3257276.1 HAD family phosphatase [Ruminococcus callidus]
MSDIKTVIFDMDGVLLDTERVMHIAWDKAAKSLDFKEAREAGDLAMGRNRDGVRLLFEERYPYVDYAKFDERYHRYCANILKKEGVPIKESVFDTVDYLKRAGYKVGVATSTSSTHALPQLEEVGIYRFFDVIMTGDTVKKGKPDPEIYLKACNAIGSEPCECYAVEDSPNGIKSAYEAGMKPVFIPDLAVMPDEYRKYIYKEFDSMTEFLKFLMKKDGFI